MQYLPLTEELRYFQSKYRLTKELQEIAVDAGYTLFEPEFFESYDRFVRMNPRVKSQSLVKLLDSDGSVLVLRPDITTSVIKRVMPKWPLGSTLKLFYLSTIFSRSAHGTIEEQKQFGIEHLGTPQTVADRETLSLVLTILKRFDIPFLIEVSNNRFLQALIDSFPWSEAEKQLFKTLLYAKNQDGLQTFLLQTEATKDQLALVRRLLNLQGSMSDVKAALEAFPMNSAMTGALDDLDRLMDSLPKQDVTDHVRIDLTVLSHYDYYDGLVFKAYVPSVAEPILSGGRYDPLTATDGFAIPAIGFTLNTRELLKEVIRHEL